MELMIRKIRYVVIVIVMVIVIGFVAQMLLPAGSAGETGADTGTLTESAEGAGDISYESAHAYLLL